MKTVVSTFFAVLVCFTGIQRVIGEPVSVAPHGNDSGAAVDSLAAFNPAEDTTAADTEYAPRTSAPLFLPEDSLFKDEKEAGHVDSTRVSAQTDTSGTVAAMDTPGRRPDSGALELSETVHLYPGISVEQHALARLMLDYFYNADWDSSDIAAKNLQKLKKNNSFLRSALCSWWAFGCSASSTASMKTTASKRPYGATSTKSLPEDWNVRTLKETRTPAEQPTCSSPAASRGLWRRST
jgi:hypothetical protein